MTIKLKHMDGMEVWTNAFGDRFEERVCVGVEYPNCIREGKKFRPTKEEVKDLFDDFIEQEIGSPAQIAREAEEEFGGRR